MTQKAYILCMVQTTVANCYGVKLILPRKCNYVYKQHFIKKLSLINMFLTHRVVAPMYNYIDYQKDTEISFERKYEWGLSVRLRLIKFFSPIHIFCLL